MNISINGLRAMRKKLEEQYSELDKQISKHYSQKNDDMAEEKIGFQDLIDQQLDIIDTIIYNLENTPKMYNELMELNQKYKRVVGD